MLLLAKSCGGESDTKQALHLVPFSILLLLLEPLLLSLLDRYSVNFELSTRQDLSTVFCSAFLLEGWLIEVLVEASIVQPTSTECSFWPHAMVIFTCLQVCHQIVLAVLTDGRR